MVKQWKLRDILTVEDIQRLEDGVARADTNHSEVVQKIATHESSRSNPHGVTAGQVGAYTKSEVDQKLTANKQATDTALNEHVKLKNNPHGVTAEQVGTYDKKIIDSRIASSLTSSKEYTNQKLAESTVYTDEKVSEVKEELKTSTVASANKLQTARRIAGNLFDGTADISISAGQVGAYTKSEVDGKVSGTLNSAKSYTDGVKATIEKSMSSSIESLKTQVQSGSVASANKLATPRLINGHEFDGTDDITITASDVGAYTTSEVDSKVSSATSGVQSNLNSHVANKQNPHGVTAAQVGTYTKTEIDSKDSSTLSSAKGYADTKKTEATQYTDSEVSKAKTAITSGNVASASKLATARRISGVLFDGTADISIPANNVGAYTKAEVDSRDSGTLSSAKSYTDSQVGAAKSTIVAGNVASASKLATARQINGVYFDGTKNISISPGQIGTYSQADINSKDAATLSSAKSYADGKANAVQTNLNSHTGNRSNPHGVTAGQVGTYTKTEIDSKDSSTLSSAKSYTDSQVSQSVGELAIRVDTLEQESIQNANDITNLEEEIENINDSISTVIINDRQTVPYNYNNFETVDASNNIVAKRCGNMVQITGFMRPVKSFSGDLDYGVELCKTGAISESFRPYAVVDQTVGVFNTYNNHRMYFLRVNPDGSIKLFRFNILSSDGTLSAINKDKFYFNITYMAKY